MGDTVKVRIAVSMTPRGIWVAYGADNLPTDAPEVLDRIEHTRGRDTIYVITAEVPKPEREREVAGTVEQG